MPRFVVHEHHASHLHWDLRLEADGALASWAMPKGPSMDPADKRLAIRVEDHELSYIDFEGTIEEGRYGAGEVRIWDSGEFSITGGALKDEKLEILMKGKRLKGVFAIFRMKGKGNNWLLIKKRDGHEQRGFVMETIIKNDS